MTQVKDVRAEQVAELNSAIATAAAKAKQVASGQEDADKKVKAAQADLTKLQSDASILRQRFATATMKQEQHAIELQLYENRRQQLARTASLAVYQDQLAAATQQSQSLTAKVTALNAALTQASSDLSAAGQADAATANDRAVLATQVADAVREARGDEVKAQVTTANNLLAALVGGANMAAVLRARYDHAQAIIRDKQDAVARAELAASAVEQLTASGADPFHAAAAGYDEARLSVQNWATKGAPALAGARQALQQTIGTAPFPPPVTSDISDRSKTATDSGAAAADKAFHDASMAVILADARLDAVTRPKAAVDPSYDPAGDSKVKAERDAADAAAKELAAAQAARTDEFKQQMDDWILSLPPEALPLAIATFQAQSRIAELAALDVTALLALLDAAETAYADAFRRQTQISALRQAAAGEKEGLAADAARYAAGADQRVLAVVRGDL